MPSIPEIPGKGLVTGTTRRAKVLAGSAAVGAVTAGGLVARRVLGHRGGEDGATADPIAETPTAPPGSEDKPVPEVQPAKAKPKASKSKAAPTPKSEPKAKPAPKPKSEPKAKAAPKPKSEPKAKPAAKPKPPKAKAGTRPKAAKPNVAARAKPAKAKGPHAELNNPVVDDPDLTEYPDPYDTREDPRDPADPDGMPFGEEPHPQTGSESTSEPPLSQDPEVVDGGKPPKRDKLDD